MSKQLFEFVKVAAGEPFPFESKDYTLFIAPDVDSRSMLSYCRKGNWVGQYQDYYILRPAESPDAGREALQILINKWKDGLSRLTSILNYPDAESEMEISPRDLLDCLESFVSDLSSLPNTNVGDIPAGREGEQSGQQFNAAVFAEAMCNHAYRMAAGFGLGEGIQWHDLSEIEKQWTIAAVSEAFTEVTPSDPGSQVEAVDPVKLLEWVAEIDLVYLEDKKGWFGKTNWKHDGVNHEQLATLYKQSL